MKSAMKLRAIPTRWSSRPNGFRPVRLESKLALASSPSKLALADDSRVAVIGGGPAGSLFSYFLLRMAAAVGLSTEVDIFEPRSFRHAGPAGCNHCGGIVSESLVQLLATEGINLPSTVVQRGIDSYVLHMDVGSVCIDTPLHEKRIAGVYRGNGPRESRSAGLASFDGYLQELAVSSGARIRPKLVNRILWEDERPEVHSSDGFVESYDLVVVATGINSNFLRFIEDLEFGYRSPGTVRTFICEYRLGRPTIEKQLGPSMHVFMLDIPRLEFAALIPKGDYVTACLLGEDIDEELVASFLSSPQVKSRFSTGRVPFDVCRCFPRINVHAAKRPFSDRIVLIGDCGATRLYKDGIGAAYRTAKAAARTAVFHGISADDFRRFYWPTCRAIDFDNAIGKAIFLVSRQVQRSRFARRAVLRMTSNEQRGDDRYRPMSSVLWDLFTGSAAYREILLRTVRPSFVGSLSWNLLAANWRTGRRSRCFAGEAYGDR